MGNLNDLLSRIQTDYEFYLRFRKNPQETLTRYELSVEERATLTEGGARLWAHLKQTMPTTQTYQSWNLSETPQSRLSPTTETAVARIADSEFDPEVVRRSEVNQTLAQIQGANAHVDRMQQVLTLIEEVGEYHRAN